MGKSGLNVKAVISNMKDFIVERDRLNRVHENTLEKLESYAGSRGYKEKKEAEDMRHAALMLKLQNAYINKHNDIIARLSDDLDAIVTHDVPEGISADVAVLESYKTIPASVQRAYLKKYQSNYPAVSAIRNIIEKKNNGKSEGITGFVIPADSIKSSFKMFDNAGSELFTGRLSEMQEAIMFREGGELEGDAAKVDGFLSGGFADSGSDSAGD